MDAKQLTYEELLLKVQELQEENRNLKLALYRWVEEYGDDDDDHGSRQDFVSE